MIELSLEKDNYRIVNPQGTVLEEVALNRSTWKVFYYLKCNSYTTKYFLKLFYHIVYF